MKIAIPTDDGKTVGKVFGRAANFAFYDTENQSIVVLENDGKNAEHGAGTGAASFLEKHGVKTLVAPEVGPKAASALAAAGISVRTVEAGIELETAAAAGR